MKIIQEAGKQITESFRHRVTKATWHGQLSERQRKRIFYYLERIDSIIDGEYGNDQEIEDDEVQEEIKSTNIHPQPVRPAFIRRRKGQRKTSVFI